MDKKIIGKYADGESVVKIAEEFNMKPSAVYWVLRKNKTKLRTHSEAGKTAVKNGRIKTGENSPYWKGGIIVNCAGYVVFSSGPNKNRPVHVVMVERLIGRRLINGEVVHHKNGDKLDNSLSNLRLWNNSDHLRYHATGKKHTEESKRKMSNTRTGLYVGDKNKKWRDTTAEEIKHALSMFKLRKDAAKYLGMHKCTLKEKMKYHGIYSNGTIKDISFDKIRCAIENTNCITNVARSLSVEPKTIKYKLYKFGTTYEEIKNASNQ